MFTSIGIDIIECSKSLKMLASDDKPDVYKFFQYIDPYRSLKYILFEDFKEDLFYHCKFVEVVDA